MIATPRGRDLELLEEIGRGSQSVVHLARRGGQVYALKLRREEVASGGEAAERRFRREAALLGCLHPPSFPEIFEVGLREGRPYLLLELIEGRSLSAALSNGPLAEAEVVSIARALAAALAQVHRLGLVHRDLKPQNVLLSADGRATLIDFGFVARARQAPEEVAGTFLYCAPEQSGMLKRPIDGRADLYALGGLLFEAIEGRPPFIARDIGELMRQHAVEPAPELHLIRPQTNPALSAIVGKLLAKDPDDRYQTALGLLADLDRLAELTRDSESKTLSLGLHDGRDPLVFEVPLAGRARELAGLAGVWREVAKGRGGLAIIEGGSGSGKSRLAHEAERLARASGGLVLRGRSAQTPTPLGPLREALEEHVRYVRRLPPPKRREAEERLRTAAGDDLPLIVRFVPALASLLGQPTAVADHRDVQEQAFAALSHFILCLAGPSSVLLLLEDVQWLDDATRQVLRRIVEDLRASPLLVLATSRTEEEFAASLARFAQEVGPALVSRTPMEPLSDEALSRLITEELGGRAPPQEVRRAVQLFSHGLPFAAIEYLRAMLDEGVLAPHWETWRVDLPGLERLKLPSDVLELLVRRLGELDAATRQILTAAAALGSRFALRLLPAAADAPLGDIHRALDRAREGRLIESHRAGVYTFVHDRVLDVLLAGLDEEQRQALHRRIALALDEQPEEGSDYVYARARHFALGADPQARDRIFETNLAAGRHALETGAHEEAQAFLETARSAARAAGRPPDPALEQALGEACQRSGRLAEAIAHFTDSLALAPAPLARVEVRARLAQTHLAAFDTRLAWAEIALGFAELGRPHPSGAIGQGLSTLGHWLSQAALHALHWGFGKAAGEGRERERLVARLCDLGAHVAYFDLHAFLLLQMAFRPGPSAHRLGLGRELVYFHSNYAVVLAVLGRSRASPRHSARAVSLAEQLGDPIAVARALLYQAIATHIAGHGQLAEAQHRRWLNEHGRWLDAGDFVNGCVDAAWNLLVRGHLREALAWVRRAMQRAERAAGRDARLQGHPYPTFAGALLAALGSASEGAEHLERFRSILEASPSERWRWNVYLQNRLFHLLEVGELGDPAEEVIEKHRTFRLSPSLAPYHLRLFWVYQGYLRLAQLRRGVEGERRRRLEQVRDAVRELGAAASTGALKAHLLVQKGALAGLEGKLGRAMRLLARAEQLAREIDSPWVAFEVMRQRAHVLRAQGHPEAAAREARLGLALAIEHGWIARARQIRVEHDVELSSSNPTGWVAPPEEGRADSLHLQRNLDALLEVSLACATVFEPESQARRALDVIVRNLGAERAFLFLCREGTDELELRAGRNAQGGNLAELGGYSRSVVEQVRATRQPVVISGTEDAPVSLAASVLAHDLRSIMAAPLLLPDRLVGVVYLDHRLARGVFAEQDLQIFIAIANHIAVGLETARAVRLGAERKALERELESMLHHATTDALTGLKNRRTFTDHLKGAAARARRSGRPLSAMMVDIDFFKMVNDTYGHAVGDRVLAAVARTLGAGVRASDFVARYGGEEFCLVLEETDEHGAAILGERLRQSVADLTFATDTGPLAVTVSIGIAQFELVPGADDQLVDRADAALYEAKRAGRDRVVLARTKPAV